MKARFDQALLDPLYERKYRLKQLLKKAAENCSMFGRNSDTYHHNLDTTFQNEFDLLISDESTISGKTLINSMEMLNKNIQTHDERKIPKWSSWISWTGLVKKSHPLDRKNMTRMKNSLMKTILEEYQINSEENTLTLNGSKNSNTAKWIPASSVLKVYIDRILNALAK
jgi:hypothetical protein